MTKESEWLDPLASTIVSRLSEVDGVAAIVLGGSRARGTARPDSDVDIGLYYDPARPFAVEALSEAARELDDDHRIGLMTAFGEWGPGVNGGGWLMMGSRHVDLLYRDLRRVEDVIHRCRQGQVDAVYQLGHPMGFQNQIYAGEIQCCRPLHDPSGEIGGLKQLVADYPSAFRRALCTKHLFDAGFELGIAEKAAGNGDGFYVSGCLFRATGFMILVLYALNRRFFMNEKGAFAESRGFALLPADFHDEIAAVLSRAGKQPDALAASVSRMCSNLERLERLTASELSR